MELLNYLNNHFLTKQQLLDITKVSEGDFFQYQEQGLMPKCSYKLTLDMQSDSFFGVYQEAQVIEYYAKGYASWLAIIQSKSSADEVFNVFAKRYKIAIDKLATKGYLSTSSKVHHGLEQHINDEWQHFLNGIYGLCTQSGLPEDIAAKELSILIISELCEMGELTLEQIEKLTKAVNLLDESSALFAPHERQQSSRYRLIDEVRRKYRLPCK